MRIEQFTIPKMEWIMFWIIIIFQWLSIFKKRQLFIAQKKISQFFHAYFGNHLRIKSFHLLYSASSSTWIMKLFFSWMKQKKKNPKSWKCLYKFKIQLDILSPNFLFSFSFFLLILCNHVARVRRERERGREKVTEEQRRNFFFPVQKMQF